MRKAKRHATAVAARTHLLPSPQTTLAQEQVVATELLLAMKSEQLKGLKRDWALVAGASDTGIGVDDFLFLLSRHTASIAVAARMPQPLLLAAMLDLFSEIDSMGSSSGLVEWSQFSRQLMHAAQVGDPAPLQASGGQGSGQGQEWVPSPLRMGEAAGQRGRAEGAVNVAAMAAVPGTERLACTQRAATLSLYHIPHCCPISLLGTEWLLVCDAPGGAKSESEAGRHRLALWSLTAHEASMSRLLQAGCALRYTDRGHAYLLRLFLLCCRRAARCSPPQRSCWASPSSTMRTMHTVRHRARRQASRRPAAAAAAASAAEARVLRVRSCGWSLQSFSPGGWLCGRSLAPQLHPRSFPRSGCPRRSPSALSPAARSTARSTAAALVAPSTAGPPIAGHRCSSSTGTPTRRAGVSVAGRQQRPAIHGGSDHPATATLTR